jgi:hypothetical protein
MVVKAYLESVDAALVASAGAFSAHPGASGPRPGDGAVVVEQVSVLDADGRPTTDFDYGDGCTIRLRCLARGAQARLTCRLTVRGDYGPLFSVTSQPLEVPPGLLTLGCRLSELPLLPGVYRVEVEFDPDPGPGGSMPEMVAAFRVTTDLAAFGSHSPVGATKSRGGFLAVPYTWRLESADGVRDLPGLHVPEPTRANPANPGLPIIAGIREEARGRG